MTGLVAERLPAPASVQPADPVVIDAVREAVREQRRRDRVMQRITDVTGLTSAGLMLLAVGLAAWGTGYYVGGRPLYLMAYGAAGALLVSWVVGRRGLPLTGERSQLRARLREGESLVVDVGLTAKRRLSTLILEEQLPASLGLSPRVPIAELAEGQSAGHRYEVTCWRRGVYEIGPLVVRWGDPFGVTSRKHTVCPQFQVLVHPRVEPAHDRPTTRRWEDPPQRPPFSRPWPSGLDFYGMRPYSPGDDLRSIVWRAYARTGHLLVREAEQGVTDKLLVLLDLDIAAHSSGAVSESFEQAVRVVAALGVHHLREGYTVTVEGNREPVCRPVRGGSRSSIDLLDALATVAPVKSTLDDMLSRTSVRIASDSEVFVVTPRLTPTAILRLRLLVGRGVSVKVVALVWDDEAVDHLGQGAALGLQIIEIGPTTNLTMALRHEVGGIRR